MLGPFSTYKETILPDFRHELETLDPNVETFVRPITLFAPRGNFGPLEPLLWRADREFALVGMLTRAEVIPHEWGLIPGQDLWGNDRRLPVGTRLGAKVERVAPSDESEITEGAVDLLVRGCRKYRQLSLLRRKGLSDINPSQFVHGTTPSNPEPTFHLVDIDPKFHTITTCM